MQQGLPIVQRFIKGLTQATLGCLLLMGTTASAQIYEPEGLNLPGQWNGFTNPPASGSVFGSSTQAAGTVQPIVVGTRRWQTHIRIAASNADTSAGTYSFLFTSGAAATPYSNKWAGVNVQLNTLQNYQYNTGADNSITVTNNHVYTCNWEDRGYQANRAIFMETTNYPVSIVSQSSSVNNGVVLPQTPVNVNVTLSAVPSPEEKFYLRYSSDFFNSSSIIPLNVNLTNGTATIPGFNSGVSITYYIFSTTIANPTADYDLYTLEYLNDNGLNFLYAVTDPLGAFNLGGDQEICQGSAVSIGTDAAYDSFLWSTGAQTSHITVSTPGTYWLQVSLGNQTARDSIVISNPTLSAIDLGDNQVICSGNPLTLSAGVSVSPQGDSLVILYDATQGQSGLVGASSVYMHSSFEYVPFGGAVNPWIGNWGVDDGLGEMTSLGNNLWTITIHPYSYYGIPADSSINGLVMVFRNADGTLTGKDGSGNDIFLSLTQTPPYSAFAGVTAELISSGYTDVLWSTGATSTSITVNQTGSYWVSYSSIQGCTLSDTVNVTANESPVLTLGNDTLICNSASFTLTAPLGFASYQWSNGNTNPSFTSSITGTYVLTVANESGCTDTDQITISENVTPVCAFTTQAQGWTVNFNDQSAGTGSYSWDFENNGSIDATTAGDVTHSYTQDGTYQVKLIITNPCGTDTLIQAVSVTTVGIESAQATTTRVYPNPAAAQLFIETTVNKGTIRVLSSTGALVAQQAIVQGMQEIKQWNALPEGIYLLEIIGEKSTSVQRVVRIQE